jgi:hypothetical protein
MRPLDTLMRCQIDRFLTRNPGVTLMREDAINLVLWARRATSKMLVDAHVAILAGWKAG